MSESSVRNYSVFNHREQPVEIHLENRVVVLGPGETTQLAEGEVSSQHLQALHRLRLITVLERQGEAPKRAGEEQAAAGLGKKEKSPDRRKRERRQ